MNSPVSKTPTAATDYQAWEKFDTVRNVSIL